MSIQAPVPPPLIPENAPFSPAQRAWLNGFFAGLIGTGQAMAPTGLAIPGMDGAAQASVEEEDDDFPWHDAAIELDERMQMAQGKPIKRRMMAAMGQLDCGQCGYDCKLYAEKIADGSEPKLTLCQPGGKPTQRMLKKLLAETGDTAPAPVAEAAPVGRPEPVTAKFRSAIPLNAPDSAKDTRHIVIDLAGTGLSYEPGDSLGVHAANDPILADAIIQAMGASGGDQVGDGNGHGCELRAGLIDDKDLKNVSEATFRLLAEIATDTDDKHKLALLAEDEDPDGDFDSLDLLDVLERFPSAKPDPKALFETLEDLQPRLYSISSSPRAHANEVHLTVGVSREELRGRQRNGVASTFFADRIPQENSIRVYRQKAHGFALPTNSDTPIIMVGPGTGIAPFRAFLEERRAQAAGGKSWLFFGNPHSDSDFLYKHELDGFRDDGVLTRLDTAFSRDQGAKVYVQDRIAEAGDEVWQWLDAGAHVYICGDAKRMAADVEKALIGIAEAHGKPDGKAFLKELTAAGRYQKDVY